MSNETTSALPGEQQQTTTTDPVTTQEPERGIAAFDSRDAWELAQRQAKALAASTLVPKDFRNNIPNCLIALEMAHRMNVSPMIVLQNLYIVHGNPGFSSKFLIASVNASGRFTNLRYEIQGGDNATADTYRVRAWATEKSTGERLNGAWITWAMVKAEGWSAKDGSKWKTMPEQMFMYRAAAFWQRTYAPEISMGFLTAEEADDIAVPPPPPTMRSFTDNEMKTAISQLQNRAITIDMIKNSVPNLDPKQLEELVKHEPLD